MWLKRPLSTSTWSAEGSYVTALKKFCQEEDVLIIPQFVTLYTSRQLEKVLHGKKEFKLGESFTTYSDSVYDVPTDECVIHPPPVGIVYSNPEEKETPVGVVCKNIYVEYTFINAIKKSFQPFPSITTLKFENCCLSKEIAEHLAFLLADESGRWITDLSLDGNEGIAQYLPLYILLPTGIKYLSLQRCSLDDENVGLLAEALSFTDEKDHKIQVLNLGMNKIGSAGARNLAKGLRTNRTLVSLSLMGNQIEDEGVSCLCDVLKKFQLTYEEVVRKRRRTFDLIFRKKAAVERYLEMLRVKKMDDQTPKPISKTEERRKIRGPDGKIRCVPVKDLKGKWSAAKTTSGEKLGVKERGSEERSQGVEATPSEILAIAQQVESETPPDKHPFANEVVSSEDEICCAGCWSLANLNLGYNYLTETSAEYLAEVVNYQKENFKFPKVGLIRIVLSPGNSIPETCEEFQLLHAALEEKNSKKEIPESAEPVPVTSIASSRRISSSSGRRIKNR